MFVGFREDKADYEIDENKEPRNSAESVPFLFLNF